MSSPLPEMRENEAPPEIAAIYGRYREATGTPLVNLIYRHLATIPGALPWVWALIERPIRDGSARRASDRITAALSAPQLASGDVRDPNLQVSDVDDIEAILAFYHHTNVLNLVCLTTVLSVLNNPQRISASGSASPAITSGDGGSGPTTINRRSIPPLPKLGSLPPEMSALVQSLAELHDKASTAGVTPSLYLHLAHWPQFLSAIHGPLRQQFSDGSIERHRSELQRLAESEAAALAATMRTDQPPPQGESIQQVRQALEMFTRRVIPEMIVVGLVLRGALPKTIAR